MLGLPMAFRYDVLESCEGVELMYCAFMLRQFPTFPYAVRVRNLLYHHPKRPPPPPPTRFAEKIFSNSPSSNNPLPKKKIFFFFFFFFSFHLLRQKMFAFYLELVLQLRKILFGSDRTCIAAKVIYRIHPLGHRVIS